MTKPFYISLSDFSAFLFSSTSITDQITISKDDFVSSIFYIERLGEMSSENGSETALFSRAL